MDVLQQKMNAANHGLSKRAERLLLQEFGVMKDANNDQEYKDIFEKGDNPTTDVLEWHHGLQPTNIEGVSLTLWKWTQIRRLWGLYDPNNPNAQAVISVITLSIDTEVLIKMAGINEEKGTAEETTTTPDTRADVSQGTPTKNLLDF